VATASQVLILRELLVAFQGNELLLGLFLGNWLFFEAIGTAIARAASDRARRPVEVFALLQITLGLGPVVGILVVRSFKAGLGVSTGEVLGIPWAWMVSGAALLPAAVSDGAAFPLGCRILSIASPPAGTAGRAYAFSAAGSALGGLVFLIPLLYTLNPLLLASLLCLASAASALWLLAASRASAGIRWPVLGLFGGVAIAVLGSGPGWLDAWSARLQWHDHTLLETARSPYATIALVRAADQYTLFVNGSPSITIPDPGPEVEILAHFPMLSHDRPSRVLVVGGGAGGLLRELLRHPVEEIAYAEQDPLLLDTLRRLPVPLTVYELSHPRVRLYPVEGRLLLRQTDARWDIILLHLPPPGTLMLNRYYTQEFFALARSRLADDGILAFFLPGSETLLSPELAALNGSVLAALETAFRHIRVLAGEPNLFLAGDGDSLAAEWEPRLLSRRLDERRIRTGLVSQAYIRYRMDGGRFAPLLQAFARDEPANREDHPRGTFATMQLFSRVVSPAAARGLAFLDRVPAVTYLALAAALSVGLLVLQVARGKPLYVGYAALSTGFAGMVMSVVLILTFQVQHGDVYQYVGILTALFMLGGATGSIWIARRGTTSLLAVESALLLTLLLAYGCTVSAVAADLWPILTFVLMILTGAMAGAQYPVLVAHLAMPGTGVGAPAARIYVLDLAGAIFGAALAGVVFIPVIGLANTILLTAGLKAGSVLLILASPRRTIPSA
jgi:spermidine synthase